MDMRKTHKKIYESLKKKPMSKEELIESTGYSYDGIRGRISEMRKLGFDIVYTEVTEKKYILLNDATDENKVIEYIEKKRLFDKVLNVNVLAKNVGLSFDDITKVISELFEDNRYSIVQLSNNTIKILKKE